MQKKETNYVTNYRTKDLNQKKETNRAMRHPYRHDQTQKAASL